MAPRPPFLIVDSQPQIKEGISEVARGQIVDFFCVEFPLKFAASASSQCSLLTIQNAALAEHFALCPMASVANLRFSRNTRFPTGIQGSGQTNGPIGVSFERHTLRTCNSREN